MNDILKTKLALISESSGVYIFKDKYGKIIYIGKANNLKNRVLQYFTRPQVGKVKAMVNRVTDVDFILTNSEKEALILEMNLIKTHYPRYNIMLRDDAHYPYIAISKTGKPIVNITRNTKNKDYYHYGPYPRSTYAYDIVNLINKIFPTQKCRVLPKNVCLYYHLDQCLGYCVNEIEETEKNIIRKDILRFLDGDVSDIRKELVTKMNEASELLAYERAKEYHELISSIDHITSVQYSEIQDKVDKDVFAFIVRDGYLALGVFFYRNGRLLGDDYFINSLSEDIEDALPRLILEFYDHNPLPKQIIIGNDEVIKQLKLMLNTEIISPKKGEKKELLVLARKNVDERLVQFFATNNLRTDKIALLDDLAKELDVPHLSHIDLVDIAHLYGSDALGVVITFINGIRNKKLYRKYLISKENEGDDYASIKEVLERHYKRKQKNEENMPDLLLVDGGLGQLNKAKEVKEALNLPFAIASLVKNEKHQTKGLIREDGKEILFEKNDKRFFLLMQMQDEVHRFAITSHRKKRSKSFFESLFDDVKGLGIRRKERLLSAYPTLDMLKKATLEDLTQIIPENVAKEVMKKVQELEDN
ncbi:MAG: excinuclease ABC subunit UvrC [Bacilli bacterium]|jgi:excinuclease ABC subunit C